MLARVAIDQHGFCALSVHDSVQRAHANLKLIARDAILVPAVGADHGGGVNRAHWHQTEIRSSSAVRAHKALAPSRVMTAGSPHISYPVSGRYLVGCITNPIPSSSRS